MTVRIPALAFLAVWCAALMAVPAAAQNVSDFDIRRIEKRLDAAEAELTQLRNAVNGGDFLVRFEQLESEIQRLTAAVEQLGFSQRQHESNAKLKLEDFEYRIIVLEGGDPSVLFQEDAPAADQTAPDGETAPSGGTLGQLTVTEGGTPVAADPAVQARFDSGVSAVRAGRYGDGASALELFISSHPDSPLAGEAYYWLGQSYLSLGNYQSAASRFLDATTLYPRNPRAADSMVGLGEALIFLGKPDLACKTFGQVRRQYAGNTSAVSEAASKAQRAGCS